MFRKQNGNGWNDFMRYDNADFQLVADTYCDGNFRIFIEWLPNGDYFFKVRGLIGSEYGIDREHFFRLISIAEKQAKINDRKIYGGEDTRNYYSY